VRVLGLGGGGAETAPERGRALLLERMTAASQNVAAVRGSVRVDAARMQRMAAATSRALASRLPMVPLPTWFAGALLRGVRAGLDL